MTSFLAILPIAAVIESIFPKPLALIIAEYARSRDVEIVDHICWETTEPIRHTIRYDPPIIPYKLVLTSGEPTPDPEPIHSTILSCTIKKQDAWQNYYDICVSCNGNALDQWSLSDCELHYFICSNTARDYQDAYFLPIINIMHARLQNAIIHGDA